MVLTQEEKDDVYITVSIELVKMFDILNNVYSRPGDKEPPQRLGDIQTAGIKQIVLSSRTRLIHNGPFVSTP